MPQAALAVECIGVSKTYGSIRALADVTLAIPSGEVVAVIGPSGSGKSTLCRALNGLELATSGTIKHYGVTLPGPSRALTRMRADIGMVFQSYNLFPHMTVLENATLAPILVRKVAPKEARERAHALLKRVGVDDQADKRPAELSGGQQQRVAIARALAMEPRLMLFDEPTSALDPEMIKEVLDVMEALADDGMTMLVVTHEMGFAKHVAHRVVFMADGSVVEDSNEPAQFFSRPTTARAVDFLDKLMR